MSSKKRLGELLIEAGVIDDAMLSSALGHQRRWGGRIGQALLDLKLTTEATIVQALARKLGFEVARLGALEPRALESALKLVGRDFAERHHVFPMAADHSTLTVAMADPTNLALADELRFRANRRVKVCIGGDREIAEAIRAHYPSTEPLPIEAISLDTEVSGEFLPPLADPFGGGNADLLEKQMEREPRIPYPGVPAGPVREARHDLLGSVPQGGFSGRDTVEEPAPAPPAAAPRTTTGTHPTVAPAAGSRSTGPAPTPVPRPVPHPIPRPTELVLEEEAVEGRLALRPLTPKEVVVLDALERLAAGQEDVPLPVKPSQVAAALLRIMLRQKIVTQQELLDELLRK
jgi:type IV pilus assembly protein PilB